MIRESQFIKSGLLALLLTTLNNERVVRIVLLTSLLTLDVPPRRFEVLATTTGLGLTLTTTVGVINWVHTHSAN